MNFFEAQARSHSRTRKLILVMVLAVIAVVISVVAVITAAVWLTDTRNLGYNYAGFLAANSALPAWTASVTALFIVIASLYRIATLRQGGGTVARALGGTLVGPGDADHLRARLRNVVEEMAIASGIPTPEVYVLDHEPGINAFAAGFNPEDAAIAVTRGTLEILNRDELQAVIAHEFSHIFNGDMRLNIQLMGPMFGILAIGLLGKILLRSSRVAGSGRSRNNGVVVALVLGAGLAGIGYVGLLLARLIKAGVSRQREYLADASAVQFTRQTQGIAGALKKIAGYRDHSSIQTSNGEEVSHMLFARGSRFITGLMATHPPLFDRIRAVDPGFTQTAFDALLTGSEQLQVSLTAGTPASDSPATSGLAPTSSRISLDELISTVGNPNETHQSAAHQFVLRIPPAMATALESSFQVILLLPALMLHSAPVQRDRQLTYLQQQLGADRSEQIKSLHAVLQTMEGEPRLALLNLAWPQLRQQPVSRLEYLEKILQAMAMQDDVLEFFEFMLLRVYRSYMHHSFNPGQARNWRSLGDPAMRRAAVSLLMAFIEATDVDPAVAAESLRRGLAMLGAEAHQTHSSNRVAQLDAALRELENCMPRDRERVVAGLMEAALVDGRISDSESELLRAICAILECPLPPIGAAIWH